MLITTNCKRKIQEHFRDILKGENSFNPKISEELDELHETLETNFISEYEIAAQNSSRLIFAG